MNKKELRKTYLNLRKALSDNQIEQYSLQISNWALQLDIWQHSNYHIFLPITRQKEINTEYLLHVLQGKDKNIIVSKSNFENFRMKHYLLTDQTKLIVNSYGIPEPDEKGISISEESIDVVFVPLLVADKNGNRLGYGKGFYDRFLKKCRPDTLKIGLSFFEPLESTIDADIHDIALDYIIYDQGFLIIH
ncbi:MAG: 5-formyltetrahydrofolate cyclo-ligase [Nonlabens sp.]|uniref:5-formyltetrahydrofolate cyclo-ligase n=1 Tax=Nonlabens sp. TaxID=1888209 RepID=UPI003219B2A8